MSAVIDSPAAEADARAAAERSFGFVSRVLRQPLTMVCAAVLLAVIVACALAPLIAPSSQFEQNLLNVYALPSSEHLLGTDQLGRDILSRILFGGRVTLVGVLQATVVCTVIGMTLGVAAGTLRGGVEVFVMRFCDVLLAVPGLIILLVILAIFGQNETAAMVTFGVIMSPTLIRVVHGATAVVREEPYVAGARVAGLSSTQIMRRHILPAVAGPALTQISIVAALACLAEAAIGFLGLGVAPPTASWGNMVADAQQAIGLSSWILVPAGGIIAIVSLTLTLIGNGIRDAYAGRSSGSNGAYSWRATRARVSTKARSAEVADTITREQLAPIPTPVLRVESMNVSVARGSGEVCIVDDVSFEIGAGEALGIVGESGCGKSMTISGVLRVLPLGAHLAATSISFKGTELTTLDEREMNAIRGTGIAFISQEPISSLNPAFTVGHQLTEAVRLHRDVGKAEALTVARDLLTQVRLPHPDEVARKYPHELSGGMAQRVAIARALAGEPELLIADEPTTALDVSVQAEILDLLRDLRRQTGMALILVTHDWGVVAEACDRAMVMYAGEIVETAEIRTLISSPGHPYTKALLESSAVGLAPRQLLPVIPGVVPAPGTWPSSCRFSDRCSSVEEGCLTGRIPLADVGHQTQVRCIRTSVVSGRDS